MENEQQNQPTPEEQARENLKERFRQNPQQYREYRAIPEDQRRDVTRDLLARELSNLEGEREGIPEIGEITKLPEDEAVGIGRIGASLAADIGVSASGLALAGRALSVLGGPKGFAAYTAISFAAGYIGDRIRQRMVNQDSTGTSVASGLLNATPLRWLRHSRDARAARVLTEGAVKGAAMGAGFEVAQKGIDEQRLPSASELGLSMATFGAFKGVTDVAASAITRKLAGKTGAEAAKTIDRMARDGTPEERAVVRNLQEAGQEGSQRAGRQEAAPIPREDLERRQREILRPEGAQVAGPARAARETPMPDPVRQFDPVAPATTQERMARLIQDTPVGAQAAISGVAGTYGLYQGIREGDENPLARALLYASAAYGGTRAVNWASVRIAPNWQEQMKQILGPWMVLPSQMPQIQRALKSRGDAIAKVAKHNQRDAERIIRGMPEDEAAAANTAFNRFLNGRGSLDSIPERLRPYAKELRDSIDEGTKHIIENIGLGEELRQVLGDNVGRYVTRAYRAHIEGRHFRPDPRAETALRRELAGKGLDRNQQNLVLQELRDPSGDFVLGRSKAGGQGVQILMKRQDLSPATRRYLGEIDDPLERAVGTITRQQDLIARASIDEQMARRLLESGIGVSRKTNDQLVAEAQRLTRQGQPIPMAHRMAVAERARASLEGRPERAISREMDESMIGHMVPAREARPSQGAVVDAMQDILVPIPVKRALGEVSSSGLLGDSTIAGLYQTFNSLAKAAKVPLSIVAYPVQVIGNVAIAAQAGGLQWRGLKEGMHIVAQDFDVGRRWLRRRFGGTEEGRQYLQWLRKEYNDFTRLGMNAKDVLYTDFERTLNRGFIGSLTEPFMNPVGKAYQAPDTVFRFMVWRKNMDRSRIMHPNIGPDNQSHKRWASIVTNATYQNYDLVVTRVRQASLVGALSSFVSFQAELLRNTYNNAALAYRFVQRGRQLRQRLSDQIDAGNIQPGSRQAENLMRQANAATAEGMRKAAFQTMTLAAGGGAIIAWRRAQGLTDEVNNALDETFAPSFAQGDPNLYTIENGRFSYANAGYIWPHTDLINISTAAFKGHDRGLDALADTIRKRYQGDLGGVFARPMLEAITNTRFGGRGPISEDADPVERLSYFLDTSFNPGTSNEVQRWINTMVGRDGRGGQIYETEDNIMRLLGYRVNKYSAEEAAKWNVRGPVRSARRQFRQFLQSEERALPGTNVEAIYDRHNRAYQQAQRELNKHWSNMMAVAAHPNSGFTEEMAVNVMRESGANTQQIIDAMDGRLRDMPREQRETPATIYDDITAREELDELSGRDRQRAIQRIIQTEYRDDRQLQQRLLERHRSEMRDDLRGLSQRENLLRRMGPRERAQMILEDMREIGDPSAQVRYRNELGRKGVITRDVAIHMRELERGR